jgi:hypothetical protein
LQLTKLFKHFNNLNGLFPLLVNNLAAMQTGDRIDPPFEALIDFVKRNKNNFHQPAVKNAFNKKLDRLLAGSLQALI